MQKNHKEYAEKHGYNYESYDETSLCELHSNVGNAADAHWIKPEVIGLAFRKHDFVFWTDLDSVFHNQSRSLQDLLELDKDFVFTGDHNDLCNAGHLLFRKSEWTQKFLKDWYALRFLVFPKLHTSMQGISGHVGDQVALNYLLAGGEATQEAVSATATDIFNSTNGWLGNPDRKIADFGRRIAPTFERNLPASRSLIAPSLRPRVQVVVQHRLNAYPWWTPRSVSSRKGPIIHFVSPYKSELVRYFEGKPPGAFGAAKGSALRAVAKTRAFLNR